MQYLVEIALVYWRLKATFNEADKINEKITWLVSKLLNNLMGQNTLRSKWSGYNAQIWTKLYCLMELRLCVHLHSGTNVRQSGLYEVHLQKNPLEEPFGKTHWKNPSEEPFRRTLWGRLSDPWLDNISAFSFPMDPTTFEFILRDYGLTLNTLFACFYFNCTDFFNVISTFSTTNNEKNTITKKIRKDTKISKNFPIWLSTHTTTTLQFL